MRPIDADALLHTLGVADDCGDCPYNAGVFCGNKTGFITACNAISDAPTIEPQQRWIPCKTALPEKGQYVLCQCRAGIMDVLHLTDDNGWYKDSTHIYMHGFVLAWMPLPEPWEGEEND